MSIALDVRLRSLRNKLFQRWLDDEIENYLRGSVSTGEGNLLVHLNDKLNRRVSVREIRGSISRLTKSGRASNENGEVMIADPGTWTLHAIRKEYGLAHGSAYRTRESFDNQFEIIRKAAAAYRFNIERALNLGGIENVVSAVQDDLLKLKDPSTELHTTVLSSRKPVTTMVQVIGIVLTIVGLGITLYLGLR